MRLTALTLVLVVLGSVSAAAQDQPAQDKPAQDKLAQEKTVPGKPADPALAGTPAYARPAGDAKDAKGAPAKAKKEHIDPNPKGTWGRLAGPRPAPPPKPPKAASKPEEPAATNVSESKAPPSPAGFQVLN